MCFGRPRRENQLENGRHWFDDALLEAGIKNFWWHDLRHTFASRLLMKGAALEDIADFSGAQEFDHDEAVHASGDEQS